MKTVLQRLHRVLRFVYQKLQHRNLGGQRRHVSDALLLSVRVALVGTAVAFLFYMLSFVLSIGDVTVSALALIGSGFILYTLTDTFYRDGGLFAFAASLTLPIVAAIAIPMTEVGIPPSYVVGIVIGSVTPFAVGLIVSLYIANSLFLFVMRTPASSPPAPVVATSLDEQKPEVAS